jgi:tetratricopeptide (TPR) repeat protein
MTEYVQNNSRDFWLEESCFLCQSDRYAEALAYIDRAIALSSNDCQAWNYRGNALSGMKRYGEALAAYERAVAFAPEYHQAWFNRGLLLIEMGALSNAIESFKQAMAVHLDPRYLHASEGIWLKKKLFAI